MPIAAITTDRQISALKPLSAVFEVAVRDCRGLYVRVFPTGTRNFELRYTSVGGARRRLGLGAWPELTLAQARIRAGEKRIAVLDGSDPAAERNQARLEARTGRRSTNWRSPIGRRPSAACTVAAGDRSAPRRSRPSADGGTITSSRSSATASIET